MRTSTVFTYFFLSQVSARIIKVLPEIQRDVSIEVKVKRNVDSVVEPVAKRQSTASNFNITIWNEQTIAACTSKLEELNGVASNPSGLAACYNVPFWNSTSGEFQADLRLFMISQPSGSFAGISAQDVQIDLSYSGASVSSVDNADLTRRDDTLSLSQVDVAKRSAAAPALAQTYAFYGQTNKDTLESDSSTIQQALVPVVTLKATNAQGQLATTSLSTTEAAFVNGVFAQQKSVTEANIAQPSPPLQTLVVAPGETFVMPGRFILITPIGGIITGTWALLLIATVAYGTVRRMQFKDQYRRRVARAIRGKVVTI